MRRWCISNREWVNLRTRCRRYGISVQEYEKKADAQNRCCKICNELCELRIDHKNETVRDLLCTRCNTFVGFVEKNPTLLPLILDYLHKWGVNV
jgi:hypothetical protein